MSDTLMVDTVCIALGLLVGNALYAVRSKNDDRWDECYEHTYFQWWALGTLACFRWVVDYLQLRG